MIQTISLYPGVTLRCFPDTRFKQGTLTVQFLRQMSREEASLNALLPAVLLRGCENAPDMRSITAKLDDLYGASVGTLVRRVGDYQTTGLACGFMEDAYALEGDAILAPMVDFLRQLLLEPVLEGDAFCADYVESEKKNLISAIESTLNNKRAYANAQLLKAMCKADSFGIPQFGEPEQVAAITPQSLYDHYRKVLRTSPVNLFYVGSAQPEQVAALLKPVFAALDHQHQSLPEQTGFHQCPGSDTSQVMNVAQGKLCMGYVTDITLRHPDFAAMQVMNTVLGAGMTSKLFMQVREKMSLCYDIGSAYHGSKGIVLVGAGIDFDQEQNVRREVEHQLQLCRDGEISPEELEAAKEQLQSQLTAIHDAPNSIENYYSTGVLSGLNMDPGRYCAAVKAVQTEDVSRAARSLGLHSVFFLRGEA